MECQPYPVHLHHTATDAEILDCLRRVMLSQRRLYESENSPLGIHHTSSTEVNTQLASVHPSELPSCFVAAGPQWTWPTKEKSWRAADGIWKEKNRRAVRRSDGATSRSYVGVKRQLDFHRLNANGGKTGWTMTQYYNLRLEGAGYLVIEDEMTICKVFQLKRDEGELGRNYSQGPLLHPFPVIPGPLPEYTPEFLAQFHEDLTSFNPAVHPIYEDVQLVQLVQLDGGKQRRPMKRGGRSGVWEHFTRIHSKDPNDVYAACHMCDGMLKAHSQKNGTSQLWRHHQTSCPCKAPAAPTN